MLRKFFVCAFLMSAITQAQASSKIFSPESPLCNVVPAGWKDKNNFVARGFEYCLIGTSYSEVFNLTQAPVYVANPSIVDGDIYKVQGQSKFKLPGPARVLHILSESDGAVYRDVGRLIIGAERNGKLTRSNFKSNRSNLRYLAAEKVPPFVVNKITMEAPIYMGGILEDYGSEQWKYSESNVWGVVVPAIIGGAGAGAMGAWDPEEACGGDIVRGMFVGGVTGALGATVFATGAGTIVTPIATAAVGKSLTALCSECHASTCDKNNDKGKH